MEMDLEPSEEERTKVMELWRKTAKAELQLKLLVNLKERGLPVNQVRSIVESMEDAKHDIHLLHTMNTLPKLPPSSQRNSESI